MSQFHVSTIGGFLRIDLEGVGCLVVWTWLPFRRWRIARAQRKLLRLEEDLRLARERTK